MNVRPIVDGPWRPAVLLLMLLSSGCAHLGPYQSDHWFRGNTHTHTTLSDGDASPEVVAKWYHDRDYNFLIITDHNRFVDPNEVALPDGRREDFLLIAGEEISGSKTIHTTAMNINKVASWKYDDQDKSKIIQFHVDEAIKAGGAAILNHPNFKYAVSADDILPVRRLHMFELFNGHPFVHNDGNHEHPSTEAIWDHLLTEGMQIFAVAADDAHNYRAVSPKKANPGRGWVMVNAAQLDADMVTEAMLNGDFYATTGVFLKTCRRRRRSYLVEVDTHSTNQELIHLKGKQVEDGLEGVRIEFIGPDGAVLKTVLGHRGHFSMVGSLPYVRARITFTRRSPETGGLEAFYAWGQPLFADVALGGSRQGPTHRDVID